VAGDFDPSRTSDALSIEGWTTEIRAHSYRRVKRRCLARDKLDNHRLSCVWVGLRVFVTVLTEIGFRSTAEVYPHPTCNNLLFAEGFESNLHPINCWLILNWGNL